jgi:hypothetical protein
MDSANEERLRLGTNMLELVWSEMARKIIEKAIVVYELPEAQAAALRRAFRQQGRVIPV